MEVRLFISAETDDRIFHCGCGKASDYGCGIMERHS